ncbi:hypothetical protein CQW23_04365 [Capsicum baccatum]|uniref:TPX2 C-terminal domain-containing protein n=1 Tax=Capsicum baccatum TaxID=33114 RepID=A0A2G2XEJ7_CAPBA|nr:hypothetical protein CQW23_04365 [Capsicum baccatum]
MCNRISAFCISSAASISISASFDFNFVLSHSIIIHNISLAQGNNFNDSKVKRKKPLKDHEVGKILLMKYLLYTCTKKSNFKPWIPNGVPYEASHANGTVLSSASRLNPATKGATVGVLKSSSPNGGDTTNRKTTTGSILSLRQSVFFHGPQLGQYSNFFIFIINNTTRTSVRFFFRLEERAEKRKEVCVLTFDSYELHVHISVVQDITTQFSYSSVLGKGGRKDAREEEKYNLLAKYKEKKAEVKQFTKRLTFKATLMPCFYKEPPPKVELKKCVEWKMEKSSEGKETSELESVLFKLESLLSPTLVEEENFKIPTTRAISPKLGRTKNSTSTTNSAESGGSCFSPKVIKELRKSPIANKDTVASKGKAVKNSKTTSQSPKTSITKGKPTETKSRLAEVKVSDEITCTEKTEHNEIQPKSEMNCLEYNVARLSNPVSVEG